MLALSSALADVKTEPLRETLTDLKSAALFDALPNPLTEVETATLLDTMAKVKPKATVETLGCT